MGVLVHMFDLARATRHDGRLEWDTERPTTELAEAAGLSKSAASRHLKLLREARPGTGSRRRHTAAVPSGLARVAGVAGFLDDFWATPLAAHRDRRGPAPVEWCPEDSREARPPKLVAHAPIELLSVSRPARRTPEKLAP